MTAYVEIAEPMEGEDWWPWYSAMCGECDWVGDGYDLADYAKAKADADAHRCGTAISHSGSR